MSFYAEINSLPSIQQTLSQERFSTYLDWAKGDLETAFKIYEANSKISSLMYIPLHGVEIALRNAVDEALSRLNGNPEWMFERNFPLSKLQINNITQARDKLIRDGKIPTPGKIVAELPFGFWTSLFGKSHTNTLWRPSLHRAFPYGKVQRQDISQRLTRLRKLRNRIAHYEPIVARNLVSDYRTCHTLLDWICPITANWIDKTSDFNMEISQFWQLLQPIMFKKPD